ncbi:MAG TPA: glutathione peroxidase [Tepidisphaeraceae bacterium]|jgi:glutathione peroxidase|nr:glutathione peroxidase [Tepidisphaeraceae bacterium]
MIRLLAIIAIVVAVTFFAVRVKRATAKDVVKEPSAAASATQPAGPLSFVMKDINGNDLDLATLKGQPVLIVNVASKCGLTKQYKGLEELYRKYKDQGFVIVGAPANNFGGQEPGSDEEIKTFCSTKYDVTFPMLSKISVKGDDKHPLYQFLTEQATAGEFAGEIGWNFTKFLVDRNGQIMARFDSKTSPDDEKLVAAVETAVAAK